MLKIFNRQARWNLVNKTRLSKVVAFFHADPSASRPVGVPGGFPAFHGVALTRNRVVQAWSTSEPSQYQGQQAKADPQKSLRHLESEFWPVVMPQRVASG